MNRNRTSHRRREIRQEHFLQSGLYCKKIVHRDILTSCISDCNLSVHSETICRHANYVGEYTTLLEQSGEMAVLVDAIESLWKKVMHRAGRLTGEF